MSGISLLLHMNMRDTQLLASTLLPHELEEAARVDGCTLQGAFFRVILRSQVQAY